MRWQLHDLIIEGTTNDASLGTTWQRSFQSLRKAVSDPDIRMHLDVVDRLVDPPEIEPIYDHDGILAYYPTPTGVHLHFSDLAQMAIDFENGTSRGTVLKGARGEGSLIEDVVANGLSPHLRRRGLFMIHAFAASYSGRCALLVGHFGAGKTTTGLALLDAGWQLLANDSPIISSGSRIRSYPGLVAAFPDSLQMFDRLQNLVEQEQSGDGVTKVVFAAESLWPDVWANEAQAGIILFPQVEDIEKSFTEPVEPLDALGKLMPHAMERWDRSTISSHLTVLRELVENAPAKLLHLGRDLDRVPQMIAGLLSDGA